MTLDTLAAPAQHAIDVRHSRFVARAAPILSIADLFLLPSEQESFGLSALEAMACEVPVIASNVGGLHEVVQDGVSGFLLPPDDLDGMASRGVELLTDDALHRRFAGAGRRIVVEKFCADRVVPMYEAFYDRLARQARAS